MSESDPVTDKAAGTSARQGSQPAWLVVTRREFLERVRTKWFVIVTLLGPIGLIGLLVVPAWLTARSAESGVHIAVVDHTAEQLSQALESGGTMPENYKLDRMPPETKRAALVAKLRAEEIDGFLVLPADALDGGEVVYEGANTSNIALVARLQVFINAAAMMVRAQREGISSEALQRIGQPVPFVAKQNTGTDETSSGTGGFILGYVVMILLYMAILLYAVNVMRSVIMEKTSRVVEIMISSVKPRALMLGKILGAGAVGLFQLGIWAVVGLILLRYHEQILALVGVDAPADLGLPDIGVLEVFIVLAYFFAGYFFYAALYAAIGAMVNSEQEAQQAQMPVVLLLIIPVLCAQLIVSDPRGVAADILTLLPFSSPVLMPMRYLLGGANLGDVALSLAILLASLVAAVALSARIYRVGILMYGKRPTLRELARWLSYK